MLGLLIVIILAVIAAAVVITGSSSVTEKFQSLFATLNNLRKSSSREDNSIEDFCSTDNQKIDMNGLNCRVSSTNILRDGDFVDVFNVDICGLINTETPGQPIKVQITIQDISNGADNPVEVNAKIKEYQFAGSQSFSYSSDLGRIPGTSAQLNNWTNIAQLRIDQMLFARRSKRKLRFTTKVFAVQGKKQLALAECDYIFDNPVFGYIDLEENARQAKMLTVAVAFAVAFADGPCSDRQIELIRKWARDHLDKTEKNTDEQAKLEAAMDEALAFFQSGKQLSVKDICTRLMNIATAAMRYDVLELTAQASCAKETVGARQMSLLAELADMLELDSQRVRSIIDKYIPINRRQDRDAESVLGVTGDMNREAAREFLNKEYAKWNARVTNCDPNVQSQADQMLKLIAEARDRYVQNAAV